MIHRYTNHNPKTSISTAAGNSSRQACWQKRRSCPQKKQKEKIANKFHPKKKAKHNPNQALGIPARYTGKQTQRGREEGHEPRTGGRSKPRRWRLRSGGAPRRLLALLLQQQSPGPHRPIQERLTTLVKVTFLREREAHGRRNKGEEVETGGEERSCIPRPGVVLKSVEHERPVRRRDEVAGPHKKAIHPRALYCAFRGHFRHFVLPHRMRGRGRPGPAPGGRHVCSPVSAVHGAWPRRYHLPQSLTSGPTRRGAHESVFICGC
jgi:hypothetical protein